MGSRETSQVPSPEISMSEQLPTPDIEYAQPVNFSSYYELEANLRTRDTLLLMLDEIKAIWHRLSIGLWKDVEECNPGLFSAMQGRNWTAETFDVLNIWPLVKTATPLDRDFYSEVFSYCPEEEILNEAASIYRDKKFGEGDNIPYPPGLVDAVENAINNSKASALDSFGWLDDNWLDYVKDPEHICLRELYLELGLVRVEQEKRMGDGSDSSIRAAGLNSAAY
ncbi:hypothetical protein P7C73_g1855, partial [Tremellales sp. Uapishka_1]